MGGARHLSPSFSAHRRRRAYFAGSDPGLFRLRGAHLGGRRLSQGRAERGAPLQSVGHRQVRCAARQQRMYRGFYFKDNSTST